MRILAIQPYADGAGHYGKYTVRLCQEIGKLGHEVTLCANHLDPTLYLAAPPAFRLETLGSNYAFFPYELQKNRSLLWWLTGRIRNNIAVWRRALSLAEEERYDIVQVLSYEFVSMWLYLMVRRPRTLPPVVMEVASASFSPEKHYGGPFQRLWRRLQKVAITRLIETRVRAMALYSASHVVELRRQLGLQEGFPIGLVSDTQQVPDQPLSRSDARQAIRLPCYEGCVFLFFGTIRPDKGTDTLLRGVDLIKDLDFRLVIAGMPLGWNVERSRSLLADPRILTRFEYIPEEQIEAYFYASDALVLPYPAFYSGSSGPLYEACARGLPVIASDVSEMGNLVRERGLGLSVNPDSPEEIAFALKQFVLMDPRKRSEMAARALALVKERDRGSRARKYVELYAAVLNGAGQA